MAHDVHWILKAEIGRRLRDGVTGVRLKDIAEATGLRLDPREASRLWQDLWAELEAKGLVTRVKKSSRESNYVDRVMLTDAGRDPEAWED